MIFCARRIGPGTFPRRVVEKIHPTFAVFWCILWATKQVASGESSGFCDVWLQIADVSSSRSIAAAACRSCFCARCWNTRVAGPEAIAAATQDAHKLYEHSVFSHSPIRTLHDLHKADVTGQPKEKIPNIRPLSVGMRSSGDSSKASIRENTPGRSTAARLCQPPRRRPTCPGRIANAACVTREEAYVASISKLSSCSGFSSWRANKAFSGQLPRRGGRRDEQERRGVQWVSLVTLQPKVVYSGEKLPWLRTKNGCPSGARAMFIANSIKTEWWCAVEIGNGSGGRGSFFGEQKVRFGLDATLMLYWKRQ